MRSPPGGDGSRWLFLRVVPEVAFALRGGPASPQAKALRRLAASLGLILEQRRPGSEHPAMQLWFRTAVPAGADEARVLKALEESPVIEEGTFSLRERYPLNLLARGWTIVTPL